MTALQVLHISSSSFRIDTGAFKLVLDKVSDLPIILLSINGASREGKSYALNYFIRYLKSNNGQQENWFESELPQNESFVWKGGSKRETVGINLWSEPFIVTQLGRRVAILLMDCQGMFDNQTTIQENAVIFSLSNLLSSVMIYNVKTKIEENLLHNLQFFSDYARAISAPDHDQDDEDDKDGREKNDQLPHLTMLVRDFEYLDEFEFGLHDADFFPDFELPNPKNYYDAIFAIFDDMPRENQCVRFEIRKNFRTVDVFILPHPGNEFLKDPSKNLAAPEFRHYLKNFVIRMCTGSHLVTKRVGGREVNGHEFLKYVEKWAATCKDSAKKFPDAKTIGESTTIMQNEAAVSTAFGSFNQRFQNFLQSPEEAGCERAILEEKYLEFFLEAVEVYKKLKKLGGDEIERQYIAELANQCMQNFTSTFSKINDQILVRKQAEIEREREKAENSKRLEDLSNQMLSLTLIHERQMVELGEAHDLTRRANEDRIQELSGQVQNFSQQKMQMAAIEQTLRKTIEEQERKEADHRRRVDELNHNIRQLASRPPPVVYKKKRGICSVM